MVRKIVALLALLALAQARTFQKGARADCTWSINNDLPTTQALYIDPNGPLNIHGFWHPQSGDIVTVPEGGQVLFACPGGTLTGPGTAEALLTCSGGSSFADENGNTYTFGSLSCSRDPFHTARKVNGVSCEITGEYSLIEIGFELSTGVFYPIIEICFNDATADSLYSKYTQTPAIGGYQSGYPRPGFVQGEFYPGIVDVDYQYSRTGQTDAVAQAVGSASLAGQYIQSSGDYFLSRGHMTAKADFVYGSHHRATFWFLNVAPQWQTVNGGNWNNLEMSTRSFADTHPNDLTVYTGTHGVTTLPDVNGNEVPIYIAYDANGNGLLRVPAFYWRVVYDETTQQGVAFVGLNNPYIDSPGSDFYLCPDVCSQISWINWQPTNQVLGYAYCCEIGALAQYVEEIPSLTVSGLLT
ncbi:Hypothetical predicted protein [Cloeon dipterum]|uniref:DNA/RNA non-specific endonuclease/pyrophosphatase/phosphodiesterase domain-containing protein n=1 Tax=Cloeon dipterum TaxID=197152 RepID=A0A8S1C410_9INSE|nr:Hypothetical predicted protein [Cloeon dipterum]